ncbi:hypothetical protein ACJJIK_12920 [Microbulbifer sp. ZKSA006]|uniref:hypothetical protein n=1 Tax=Microbulbifer sp. ZKSA006 TaxID=3243390 RepID=UPI00403908B1
MRRAILVTGLLLCSSAFAQQNTQEQESGVAEAAKSVMSSIVSFGKNLVDGASEGVVDGRKSGQSTDGAILINTLEDLDKYLQADVIAVTAAEEHGCYVEVGFKNENDFPVRLIDLNSSESVIVIDHDGYASNLFNGKGNPMEITVPSKAGRKQKFYFAKDWDQVREIRILGKVLQP